MQLKLKHLFFRTIEHKLFRLAVAVLFLWWAYQTVWVAKPEFQKKTNVTQLSDAEAEYYAKTFDYAMDALAPGQTQTWETYSSSGAITVKEHTTSKSGVACRAFEESYVIGTIAGKAEGFGCKREGNNGWCKLKSTDARTCVLEAPKTATGRALREASEAVDSAKLLVKGTIDFW